jgi:HPr kinase/phosphorylase
MRSIKNSPPLTVRELLDAWGKKLELTLAGGSNGINREITKDKVQKPGLRIIETSVELENGKIQILGRTEIDFYDKLSSQAKVAMGHVLAHQPVPCFILTKGIPPPMEMAQAFEEENMPLLISKIYTGRLISLLNNLLEERLAASTTLHGILMDIHGLGVLIIGKSGIGKSENALDLILRGAKLVADDVVIIRKLGNNRLLGTGSDAIKHLMEIRGVGIINVKDMFGTMSVLEKREIDMVIELKEWEAQENLERVGLDTSFYSIMDVDLPYTILPVSPGRNIATIIDVAVRNQILKSSGLYPLEDYEKIFDGKKEAT